MNIKFSKELYNKEIITKAAYYFTDDCYVSLDTDDRYFYVSIAKKDGTEDSQIERDFCNEVITQAARYNIMIQTKDLREIVVGRALASTILTDSDSGFVDDESYQADEMIYDWFERHDSK